MSQLDKPASQRPATWAIVLAFALVYLCWGTTYLAIKVGVRSVPPALFGGSRICLAGLLLLTYVILSGKPRWLPAGEWKWMALTSFFLFMAGNGLITAGERTVDSSVAAVLVATTPLWAALLEMTWPTGDRLTARGWVGLFLGLGGVALMLARPDQKGPDQNTAPFSLFDAGPWMVLASAGSWAVGAFLLRHRRSKCHHLTATAYQMIMGGAGLMLIGVLLGETQELVLGQIAPSAVAAFFHLLVAGSLVGYVAYSWLLGHVSVTKAGTYAYVNPVVAILVGWLLGDEPLTREIVGGMAIILAGVALVRTGERKNPVDETQTNNLSELVPYSRPTPSVR